MNEILAALGYIGDSLDKPGRAVRGLLAGRPDELAAAVPFSDSLGLTDESRSTSGKELLRNLGADVGDGLLGDAAGFATEVATDPLTLLGGGAGARLGRAAEKAAVAAGPRYATTADDLGRMLAQAPYGDVLEKKILESPQASRLLSEINPDAKFIGSGVEAFALREPSGSVTRIGQQPIGWEGIGRPISSAVAQPTSTLDFAGGMRVEKGLPFADNVGDMGYWSKRPMGDFIADRYRPGEVANGSLDALAALPENAMLNMNGVSLSDALRTNSEWLDKSLAYDNLKRIDRHFGNIGTVDGRSMVIDPGDLALRNGMRPADFATRRPGYTQPVTQASDPGRMMSALLDALGSAQTIRAGEDPRYRMLLGVAGAGGGSVAGAFGRAAGQ